MNEHKDKREEESQIPDIADQIATNLRRMELEAPDARLGPADRIANALVEIVGVTMLSGIVIVVFVNASSRYLLGHSFSWAEEMVQMAMPWLAMTGVFLSVRRGTVIRIDFFFDQMSVQWQRAIACLGYAVNIAVLALMAYVSFDFVRLFGGDIALYVQIPTGVSTSALVFGAAGAAMAYCAEFFREWRMRLRSMSAPDGSAR